MAGDNRFVTEYFLAQNFTPKSGVTPGSDNTIWMDCDQILARYNVEIMGISQTGKRWPSQNQISTTPVLSESSILLVSSTTPAKVYRYNPETNTVTLLSVPDITEAKDDIAHTANKLWLTGYSGIDEYDITLSPFSATHNRLITDAQFSAGLCAKNDTTLIGVKWDGKVYEENIASNPTTRTLIFTKNPNLSVAGDYIVTTDNKYIELTVSSNGNQKYITQFNYLTGTLEVNKEITAYTSSPFGLFEYNSVIYIANANGNIYRIDTNSPYSLTFVNTAPISINGASQLAGLLGSSLIS